MHMCQRARFKGASRRDQRKAAIDGRWTFLRQSFTWPSEIDPQIRIAISRLPAFPRPVPVTGASWAGEVGPALYVKSAPHSLRL